jgi:hypothetical protein
MCMPSPIIDYALTDLNKTMAVTSHSTPFAMVTLNRRPRTRGFFSPRKKKKPFGVAISCEQRLMVIDLTLALSVNPN